MKKLFIVMYHYVRDLQNSRYPAIKGLDYALFKAQIDFLQAHFNIVKMEDVINYYASEGESVLKLNQIHFAYNAIFVFAYQKSAIFKL